MFFEGRMSKNNKLLVRTKRKSVKPSISSGNENEKWHFDVIKKGLKSIDVEWSINYKFLAYFFQKIFVGSRFKKSEIQISTFSFVGRSLYTDRPNEDYENR